MFESGDQPVCLSASYADCTLLTHLEIGNTNRSDLLEIESLAIATCLKHIDLALAAERQQKCVHKVWVHTTRLDTDLADVLINIPTVELRSGNG